MERKSIDIETHTPKQFIGFVNFFKKYMNLSVIIVACLPIPINYFSIIPVFEEQKGVFMVYTSMFCFLILGFIFYLRIPIAKILFQNVIISKDKKNEDKFHRQKRVFLLLCPLIFICLSFWSVFAYHHVLNQVYFEARNNYKDGKPFYPLQPIGSINTDDTSAKDTYINISNEDLAILNDAKKQKEQIQNFSFVLKNYKISQDQNGYSTLMLNYFSIFIFAEIAFIIMALREYMQQLLKIEDEQFLKNELA